MVTLKNVANDLRTFFIIDACFAGQAAFMQSSPNEAVGTQIRSLSPPRRGIAFYCSSSRDVVSEFLPDESNTVFTQALTESLWDGVGNQKAKLSLEDIDRLVIGRLAKDRTYIRPEIHAPFQPEGNAAEAALFPNGPRRAALEASEQEWIKKEKARLDYIQGQAEEQARRAEKLKAERKAQDEENRRKIEEEQDRERIRQEQALKHYDSEQEKLFCEEAEAARTGDLNTELIKEWLGWKAQGS
jgi:hypothetical protein